MVLEGGAFTLTKHALLAYESEHSYENEHSLRADVRGVEWNREERVKTQVLRKKRKPTSQVTDEKRLLEGKERIAAAAAGLFLSSGYHSTSVREIAQKAGLSVVAFSKARSAFSISLKRSLPMAWSGESSPQATSISRLTVSSS